MDISTDTEADAEADAEADTEADTEAGAEAGKVADGVPIGGPRRIQLLPAEVIDQIAAGEVVERPAHLVKELVENSLDAGATEVEVDFAMGGRWISVTDNGFGMGSEELALALSRHATSKIAKSEDLWALESYGFRGEALAAIAAVSRLSLSSRQRGQDRAFQIKSEFGKLTEVMPTGGEVGTKVVIEELFSNLPARLKFLKSEAAEHQQIKNVVKALALAFPQVSFRLLQRGKLLSYWPAKEVILERVQEVFEQQTGLYWLDCEEQGVKVKAAISAPHLTVGSSRQIWLFAQRRWVQDRSLQAAVMEAYRHLLMHGEYPMLALWVEVDAEDIDVNIHPTKSQVKFRRPNEVFRAVMHSLRKTLEQAPWVEELTAGREPREQSSSPNQSSNLGRSQSQSPNQSPNQSSDQSSDQSFVAEAVKQYSQQKSYSQPPTAQSFSAPEFFRTQYKTKVGSDSFKREQKGWGPSPTSSDRPMPSVAVPTPTDPPQSAAQVGRWASLQVIGQSHLTYIVAQNERSVVFVDQHAAHERVAFERLMTAWKGKQIDVQRFLVPLILDMDAALVEALLSQAPVLVALGIQVEQAGPESIAVLEAPSLLKEQGLYQALEMMAKEVMEQGGSFAVEKVIGDICATMACHSVIRAGQALSQEQMEDLLRQMDEYPLSSFCPHGRPVFVEYPVAELERDFGRKL